MTDKRKCPKCGAEEPSNALQGLCPACVIKTTLAGLGGDPNPVGAGRPPASRLFGDYELIEEIAHGGMGVVYRARQISLNRIVAVKMIRAGLLAGDAEVKRFHAEAEAAASLDHPNIVPLYEVGEHGGQHYFSMKLIEGGGLTRRIQKADGRVSNAPLESAAAPFDFRQSARVISKVARAVHYAHQRGLIHRDLKPGNILLDAQSEPHITDFGLVKQVESSADLTLMGAVLGTPSYMSPEQAAGQAKRITTATDIYSLGAILYELLAGRPPFCADSAIEVLRKVVEEELVRPSELRSSRCQEARTFLRGEDRRLLRSAAKKVDRDLETICLKCLEKDPSRRYGSAEALAEDLERWLRHEPILARRSTVVERVLKWTRRHPAHAAGIATLFLALAAGVSGIAWQWRRAEVAHAEQRRQLAAALLAQARAQRESGDAGRRFHALAAIRDAARIRPSRELRSEATASLALVDLGPEEIITEQGCLSALPLSPNFELFLAHGREQGAVCLRRARDGQELWRLPGTNTSASSAWWSPDSRYFVVHFLEHFRVWETAAARLLVQTHVVPRPDRKSIPPAFSPDSRQVAVQDGEELVLYELPSGKMLKRLQPDFWPGGCSFHPQKPWLALMHGTGVTLWDKATDQPLKTFTSNPNLNWPLQEVTWSPDGQLLAGASADGAIYLWREAGGAKPEFICQGHRLPAEHVAFNHAGDKIVSWCSAGDTRVWDAFTGHELIRTYRGQGIAFSPDDRLLAFSRPGGGLGFWPVATGRQVFRTLSLPQNKPFLDTDLAFSADGRWLAAVVDHDGGLRIWDLIGNRLAAARSRRDLRRVYILPDDHTVLTTGPGGVHRWPLLFGTDTVGVTCEIGEPQSIPLPPGSQPHNHSCLGSGGQKLLIEDLGDHVLLLNLADPGHYISCEAKAHSKTVALSPDGLRGAIGYVGEEGAEVFDTVTGARLKEFPSSFAQVEFSPNGRWLALSTLSDFQLLDAATLQVRKVFPREMSRGQPGHITFSANGHYLAYLKAPRLIELVDAATLESLATLTMPEGFQPWKFRFSPDGGRLGAFGDGTIHLWDLPVLRHELGALGLDW